MTRLCDVTRLMPSTDEVELIFMGNLDYKSGFYSIKSIPDEFDLLFVHMMMIICEMARELPEPALRIYLSAV